MDEKELIKKVKNSLKAKKSKAEILTGFQKRGYKLAYADKLITKIKRPKKIVAILLVAIILSFTITFSVYSISSNQEKQQVLNPLSGFVTSSYSSSNNQNSIQEIEITPETITFLLNEIGAWELHKNVLTFEKPIINFKIDTDVFYSEVGKEIKTYRGLSESADLQFNTKRQDLTNAIASTDPVSIFRQSIISGSTQIEVKTSNVELFAKGYLKLYESLK